MVKCAFHLEAATSFLSFFFFKSNKYLHSYSVNILFLFFEACIYSSKGAKQPCLLYTRSNLGRKRVQTQPRSLLEIFLILKSVVWEISACCQGLLPVLRNMNFTPATPNQS